MNPSRIAALVAVTALLSPLDAAAEDRPNWTVQVDPLTTALGFVHVQLERRFGDYVSVYAGPHLRLFSAPFGDQEDFLGYGAEFGVRAYLFGTAPEGWWGLVRGVAAHLHTTSEPETVTALGGYGSVLGGYTWILGGWFVLSAGLGVQYIHYTVNDLGPKGVLPAAHTAVGFAF